ncbi:MAG: DUF167 domain-containing protein [Desulfobacterales bacterium]|nr:DUF167 domain-containing protein [Desulfobacterales bacterium]
MGFISKTSNGFVFKIHVQPRASQNAVVGRHGNALKLRITAAPVDNAANKLCVQLLAKQLRIPKSTLKIISGRTNRTKTILIQNDCYPDSEQQLIQTRLKQLFQI